MRQPLLRPSPISILPSLRIRQIEVDPLLIIHPRRNTIYNATRRIRIFKSAEKSIRRIIMSPALQHTGIKRIQSQNPVKLILGEIDKTVVECSFLPEQIRGHPCSRRHRGQSRIFPLPPRRCFTPMREEESTMPLARGVLHQLPAIPERIIHFSGYRQLKRQGSSDDRLQFSLHGLVG